MRVEGRCTVRANDLQILDSVVVSDAVDVIDDHRHTPASPVLVLAAKLASRFLQALLE